MQYPQTCSQSDIDEEQRKASALFSDTLGVLLVIAVIVGAMTGQYAGGVWCAIMAWIPACIIVGGISDKLKAAQSAN